MWRVPFAGGFWLRVLPYWFVRWGMRRFRRGGWPGLVYIHPPEFDPDKPRLPLSLFGRVLHYTGLKALAVKIPRLLSEFDFAPVGELLDRVAAEGGLPTWAVPGSAAAAAGDGMCVG